MRVEQRNWNAHSGWQVVSGPQNLKPGIVLVFADVQKPTLNALIKDLINAYPEAPIVGCSSAGEIWDDLVHTESLCATAIEFDTTTCEVRSVALTDIQTCQEVGQKLARLLPKDHLRHVLLLSDGLHVDVNAMIRGMYDVLPESVPITGGLAGDGPRFSTTWVLSHHCTLPDHIVAVGFYGSQLHIGSGSVGGWDTFGPERIITRAQGNVLYELDSQPALSLYEKYLGQYAAELPASGLLFPLSVRAGDHEQSVVRTILGFNRDQQSLTFAGEMPTGGIARLMKASFDRLIDGAASAAASAMLAIQKKQPSVALLISCVGRRLVLHQRIDEEIEVVRNILGPQAAITGFYSYGEIAPQRHGSRCQLHNQTMTITTLQEF